MIKRTLFALALVLVTGVIIAPKVVHAVSDDDLFLRFSSVDQNTGKEQCKTVNIKNSISLLKKGYAKRIVDEALRQFRDPVFAAEIALCLAANFNFFGTGSHGLTCDKNIGGLAAAVGKVTVLDTLERDFLANCVSRGTLDDTLEISRRILNENGRDGGAVYVRDWNQFMANSRYRGLQIARNDFANTKYCPWLQADMQAFFNFDPTKAVGDGGSADGLPRYQDVAGCQFPDGFDPTAPENQTLDVLAGLTAYEHMMPSAYLLAEANLAQQTAQTQLADYTEYAYTGGVGPLRPINPLTGTSCAVPLPDGTCKEYYLIQQPAAGTQAELQAQRQASYDWITNARNADQLMGDVTKQVASSLLSLDRKAMTFEYTLDQSSKDIASGIPAESTTTQTIPGPTDPARCTDVSSQTSAQALAQGPILIATQAAIGQQSGILTPDQTAVVPGQESIFLDGVCSTTVGTGFVGCRPRAGSTTDIIIPAGSTEFAISILTSSGVIRLPGQVVEACEPGVF